MPTKTAKKSSRPTSATTPQTTFAPGENPLVPHDTLRQMYLKMLHARLFGAHLASGKRKPKARLLGQEACRASVVQGLLPGDLVTDSQEGPLMELLLGTEPSELLKQSGEKTVHTALLPFVDAPGERLPAVLGAAFALKQARPSALVAVFVEQHEADSKLWRRTLSLAAQQNLPVLFVVLPEPDHDGHAHLTRLAHSSGAAAIAVEATDAIALYRVAQESMVRIRSAGGPVLIEGIAYLPAGRTKSKATVPDPLTIMRECLLQRKAATDAWVKGAEVAFRRQLSKRRS